MRRNDPKTMKLYQICERYGLSSREVFRYLMPEGLPIYRCRGKWYAELQDLTQWELETKRIYFGKTEYESMILPAYENILRQKRLQQRRTAQEKERAWREENRHLYRLFYVLFGICIGLTAISAILGQ